jgi:hypothetical protein
MTWQALADMRYRMPGGHFVGPDTQGRPKFGPRRDKVVGLDDHDPARPEEAQPGP